MTRIERNDPNAILFLVLSLLGASINVLLLICIQRNPLKCFRNISSYLVAHQAFSDLVMCLFISSNYIGTFIDESVASSFLTSARVFFVLSVTGFAALFLVSFDRFLAIRFPIRYRIHAKPRLVPVTISVIWLCTLALIVVIAHKPMLYNVLRIFLVCIGGTLVFLKLCLHCLAFWTMKNKGSQIRRSINNPSPNTGNGNQQMAALKREERFLFTVFLITVVVLLTTVPLLLTFHARGTVEFTWNFTKVAVFTLYLLGVIAGPCIYFTRLNSYHASLKKVLC